MGSVTGLRRARRGGAWMCVAAALGLLLEWPRVCAAESNTSAQGAMERFLSRPRPPRHYTAARRIEAWGGGRKAWLDARTEFSPGAGLFYEVTAEGGSGIIRSRVLRSLLDEEQRLIAEGRESAVALTQDNYEFTAQEMTEEGLAAVTLRPLRDEKALILGRMLLTPEGALRRIEGRLARNPSFWITRVDVVRTYDSIEGEPMPVLLETSAHLRFFGSSHLRMTYRYLAID